MNKSWNKEPQDSPCRACVEYFREHPVFEKLLKGFREKYVSYGSFVGTVTLRNLTEKEREDLEGFFQKNYHGRKSVSISAERFKKVLLESRFADVQPREVLEMYFQEELTEKRAQEREEEQQWARMLEHMRMQCAGTWAETWVKDLEGPPTRMYYYLRKRYREAGESMQEVQRLLLLGTRVLNALPYRQEQSEYLAVFAAMLTGNPHGFDGGTKDGGFLRMLVEWDIEQRSVQIETAALFPVIRRQRLYLAAGILRDDMSNYVMVSGMQAWKKDGNVHTGMEGFQSTGDPVQVPLSVVAGWLFVACPDQEMYIVENPSVFAILCGEWRGRKACMCMNGQPRLSSVLLLDLLAKAGVRVYYAGDFDPEGLLIAQKVKQYYKGEAIYWKMSVPVYEKSRSKETISAKRMKALERVTDPELAELAKAIRKYRVSGYQENVWRVYLEN